MGTFSVWHWIALLLMIAIPAGLAAVAASFNNNDSRLNRGGFALRVIALYVGLTVSAILLLPENLGFVLALILIAFVAYWSVSRLRDLGTASKTKAILTGLPIVGVFVLLYLLFAKGAPQAAPS